MVTVNICLTVDNKPAFGHFGSVHIFGWSSRVCTSLCLGNLKTKSNLSYPVCSYYSRMPLTGDVKKTFKKRNVI